MSKARAKGTAFESAVRDYLQKWWPHCERSPLWGSQDKGDLLGIPGFCFQIRNTRAIDLAGALSDAKHQANNHQPPCIPVAVIKRRGKNVAQAYAVFELETAAELIRAWDAP